MTNTCFFPIEFVKKRYGENEGVEKQIKAAIRVMCKNAAAKLKGRLNNPAGNS